MKVPGVIVTCCVLLAACGGGGSTTHTDSRASTSTSTGGHTSTSTGGHTGTSGGGGVGAKSPAYKTADELAAAITAAGMGCTDHVANDAPSSGLKGVPDPDSQTNCTVGGAKEVIIIGVYNDADAAAKAINANKDTGCEIAKLLGVTHVQFVEGKNWIVVGDSAGTMRTLAEKLHGKADVLKC